MIKIFKMIETEADFEYVVIAKSHIVQNSGGSCYGELVFEGFYATVNNSVMELREFTADEHEWDADSSNRNLIDVVDSIEDVWNSLWLLSSRKGDSIFKEDES